MSDVRHRGDSGTADVITQCGLALPLIALYEISIIAARMVEPKPSED